MAKTESGCSAEMRARLTGPIPSLKTPFLKDGAIDFDGLRRLIDHNLAAGARASMLTAGLDRTATRWRPAVEEGGDAWAMIALADPDMTGQLSYRQLSSYVGRGDAALKQRLFFAGLAGLPLALHREQFAQFLELGTHRFIARSRAFASRPTRPSLTAWMSSSNLSSTLSVSRTSASSSGTWTSP